MRNLTIYFIVMLCLFLNSINAQETFESRAKKIATAIEKITNDEKVGLKMEIENVNLEIEKGLISRDQADAKKLKLAKFRAVAIENRINDEQDKLNALVKEKVEGKIAESNTSDSIVYKFSNRIGLKILNDSVKKVVLFNKEKRTSSQFVFAFGLNNLVTDNRVAKSDFRYYGSHFYEWGLTLNSRILKNNNLLHAKYGLSVMYNNLRPANNRFFEENGEQTNLIVSSNHLNDSRFRNVYLVVPAHLEFDFSGTATEKGRTTFRTHKSVRIGIGAYAGVNLKSKQVLKYEDSNNNNVRSVSKGDFNTNDFIYGLSAYAGYKSTSLYLKYDLNPLFRNSLKDQNNISLGIRFDLN